MTLTARTDPSDAHMTGQAWRAYDTITGICTGDRPLPGWRVDRLYDNGEIGDYSDSGTRVASCRRSAFADAIRHDPKCECGYRLVRDVYTVIQFAHIQPPASPAVGRGHRYRPDLGFILTRATGSGWTAPRASDDPRGTIRVAKTTLREVWLPRQVASSAAEVKALAQKVRDRYGVRVHVMPGDGLYSFPGTPDTVAPKDWPECAPPTQWHGSGFYGLHGAAGVMFSTVIDGERQFLLVKRAGASPNRPGLWQLPGGALEVGETPLEAARRQTMEELAIPDLGGGTVLGEVVYAHSSGWQYTNYAISLEDAPAHHVDGLEIAHAAWYTAEEVLSISETVSMVPELAANIRRILALFPPK